MLAAAGRLGARVLLTGRSLVAAHGHAMPAPPVRETWCLAIRKRIRSARWGPLRGWRHPASCLARPAPRLRLECASSRIRSGVELDAA
jgi:hypothetical protein